jgi:formyl-CoA transferase
MAIDQAIAQWTAGHTLAKALDALATARVPAGRVYTVKDIVKDPHYQARGMLQTVTLDDGSDLLVPGVVPKLSETPGSFQGGGPRLGQHTQEVLQSLGVDDAQLEHLRQKGVV